MFDDDDGDDRGGGGGRRGRGRGRGRRDDDDGGGRGGFGGGGGGRGSGGSAGGGKGNKNKGPDPTYVRTVPKFLQAHAHLLEDNGFGKEADAEWEAFQKYDKLNKLKAQQEEEDSSEGEDDVMKAAKKIAMEENARGQTAEEEAAKKKAAEAEKVKGNKAFSRKDHATAITHFSKCIELDPTNHVFFSNRSACLVALKRHEEALKDAKATVRLARDWPKGYARLGAALYGLGDFTEAREAYEQGLKLDDGNEQMETALAQALVAERKAMEDKSHRFRKRKAGEGGEGGGKEGGAGKKKQGAKGGSGAGAGVKNAKLLSFDDDEGGEDDE